MDDNGNRSIVAAAAEEAVERAGLDGPNLSRQPRFAGADPAGDFFTSIYEWGRAAEDEEPPYKPDSRARDSWLLKFSRREPHLLGVINQVVAIDKNRGWSLHGGRNQVLRFTETFHYGWESAPGMWGWRAGVSSAAQSFYATDLGAIIEAGRRGRSGPMRRLYHVDPTRCALTGNPLRPLKYFPGGRGKASEWRQVDFMRITPMPSIDEAYRGLGLCAVSRVAEIARIMIAVYQHDLEQLGARAPRGLLLLSGVNEIQWRQAMEARRSELDGEGYRYFGPVMVLANGALPVEAKLVALSQLPSHFEEKMFTDLLMFTYALCFGYDPSEFWPVQFGALGRGKEAELQAQKATGKGGLDFMLTFQEQLQGFLPDTLHFVFDRRDEDAELLHAHVMQAYATVVRVVRETAATLGEPAISVGEARALLADWGVIPQNWAELIGTESTDVAGADHSEIHFTPEHKPQGGEIASPLRSVVLPPGARRQALRRELLEMPHVWRLAESPMRADPVVRYSWPAHRIEVIWDRADEILSTSAWGGFDFQEENAS